MENRTVIIIGVIFFVGIIVLAAVVGIGYLLIQSNKTPAPAPPPVENPADMVEEPEDPGVQAGEPEEVPATATLEPIPEPTDTPEFTPTPEPTFTPEPVNRCSLFDAGTTELALHDIPMFTMDLTFYLDFGHPVPGLEEPVEGDEGEWVYSAILGSSPTEPCTLREYTGRIYCKLFDFPTSWWGTTQPLEVFVNGCDEPIYSHDRVSILKPACEESMQQKECSWTGGKIECSGGVCKCACP